MLVNMHNRVIDYLTYETITNQAHRQCTLLNFRMVVVVVGGGYSVNLSHEAVTVSCVRVCTH